MLRFRQGCLKTLAIAAVLAGQSVSLSAEESSTEGTQEPDFRLLQIAQALADSEIQLVQGTEQMFGGGAGETVGQQGTQPIDSPMGTGLESFNVSDLDSFGFGDWSLISKSELSTDTSALLDSQGYLENLEEQKGISEIGLTEAPAVDIVEASTFNLTKTPDVAETLTATATSQAVRARRRSAMGFDPRIRGFYTGQIYAMQDGSYQFPVRSDLDGVFSKIDPSLIGNVRIISGPYAVRYGAGFAFLSVDTIPTPRYDCGWENHLRVGTAVRTNGGQTYNTATLFGGGESSGYFANVGFRKGSDYQAGDGLLIPSSYDAFNLFSGFGHDIDDNTRSEFRYTHIDQDNTEYAGQFFDVDDLKSDGITHSWIHRDERAGFGYRVDSWVNYTEFNGDTSNGSKRRSDFPVLQRVDQALVGALTPPDDQRLIDPALRQDIINYNSNAEFGATVNGTLTSAGFRAGMTQDIDRETSYGAGFDFRYVRQRIQEQILLDQFVQWNGTYSGTIPDATTPLANSQTGLPRAEVFEPGMYLEYSFSPKSYIESAVGARVSLGWTEADPNDVNERSNFRELGSGPINADLDVSDVLTAFFFTSDIDMSPAWSARIGAGYAERLPNLEQRYSDGLFLAMIQSGFSRLVGDPSLSKERNWQADVQVRYDSEYVRGRLSGFHSWVIDYITYLANPVLSPEGARLLRSFNTDYATLTGFEYYGEADLASGWQVFTSVAYLDGRDRVIDQPLAAINPLEGRAGLRWFDPCPQNRWGVEWGLRMVDNQDRLGTLRAVPPTPGVVTLETATPGFTTSYIRAYCEPKNNVHVTAGVENLFDRNYFEHLNLRLPPQNQFGSTVVLSPGITPYFGVEIDY